MNWKNKKVLITGAAGFLGAHLATRLLKEGAHVIALDNLSYGKKENIPHGVEVLIGDVLNKKLLNRLKDVDYVFHLASPSSVILFNNDPISCTHITICGLVNILEWAKDVNVRKLIFPSSGSVYGRIPLPQSEDMNPRPVNMYGISKLTCENIIEKYSDDISYVILRIFAGYGPGEEHKKEFASVITLFLNDIVNDKSPIMYGDGSQKRDFVYIDDIIEAIVRATETVKNEIINVGSGKAYTFNQVVDMINHFLGKNVKPVHINKPRNYLENTLADVRKLQTLLDIKPLDLKDGLIRYLSYKGLL
jgi:UDP-glucose 4-epimerase